MRNDHANRGPRKPRARLAVEQLEARVLLSADSNDQIGESPNLALGAVVQTIQADKNAIDPATDVDMFSYAVTTGQQVGFSLTRRAGSLLDGYLRLFDARGKQLAAGAAVTHTFATAGTYYVGVSASGNRHYDAVTGTGDVAGGSTGAFTLNLKPLSPTRDSNDQIGESPNLALGPVVQTLTVNTNAIDPATDVDMFGFSVAAGQVVKFETRRGSGSTLNSALRIFTSTGHQLAIATGGGQVGGAVATFTFPAAGTYYVGVSARGNTGYSAVHGTHDSDGGSTGAFTLILTPLSGPAPNVNDSNDQIGESPNLALGPVTQTIVANQNAIDPATDVDMFSYTVKAKQAVTFKVERRGGSTLDAFLRVFDGNGAELAAAGGSAKTSGAAFVQYTFPAAGTYYVGVSASGNEHYSAVTGRGDTIGNSTGLFTLTLKPLSAALAGDSNDQIGESPNLALGPVFSTIPMDRNAIDPATDVDMFSFNVAAKETVGFDVTRNGGALNAAVRVFDHAGNQLAADSGIGKSSGEASTQFTFAAAGTYYVGVSARGNTNYNAVTGTGDVDGGSTGAYRLTLTRRAGPRPVFNDPHDQIAEAIALGTMTTTSVLRSGTIDPNIAVVMYSLRIQTAGQSVAFDIDCPGAQPLDSYLRLFDAMGKQLAFNDDGAAPGEPIGTASYLTYTFAKAGTYYVGVSAYLNSSYNAVTGNGDQSGGSVGPFQLTAKVVKLAAVVDDNDQIGDVSPDTQDFAPGAARAKAASKNADQKLGQANRVLVANADLIDPATDVDMFSFSVAAAQKVAFDIDHPAGSSLNAYLRLFDAKGKQLAANDDRAAPGEKRSVDPYIAYTFKTGGVYYIGVSAKHNTHYDPIKGTGDVDGGSTGDYTLTLTGPRDSSDPNDQISEVGAPLKIPARGRTVTGTVAVPTDVNLVGFTASAGQTLAFNINLTGHSTLNSYLRIFDADGAELAHNDNGAGPDEQPSGESYLTWTFNNAGTYYVGVSASGNTTYRLTDGGGDRAGATTGAYHLVIAPAASRDVRSATGSISGLVFNDSEPTFSYFKGAPGQMFAVTLYLDLNNDGRREDGEPRTVNDPDGRFEFDGVSTGARYYVRIAPAKAPDTLNQKTTVPLPSGTALKADLTAGGDVTDLVFGTYFTGF